MASIDLNMRSRRLGPDESGRREWQVVEESASLAPDRTALLLCDVWNDHTCQGAVDRLEAMIPRIEQVVTALRDRGVFIIHAPSDTMEFYRDSAARNRMLDFPSVEIPELAEHADPPLPVDATEGGCDTALTAGGEAYSRTKQLPWTRQHPGVTIDETRDGVACVIEEIYPALRGMDIQTMLILGVHTNMCILHRSFGIKRMVRLGQPVALVRDLTDTMYDPARSPYVSHDEGTRLVVEFIEKFWCPTIHSNELV
jgi:nicotinamidase-related amidase